MTSTSGKNRRELFRINLPKDYVVVCLTANHEPSLILDLAEFGIRCLNKGDWNKHDKGRELNFQIAYPDGEVTDYRGVIVRVTKNDVALRIPKGIALSKMMDIQRELITRFNVTEF